ncbi:hypothetical protein AK812_SmicGene30283 [Symbiodinium microadriaticum]|uniref:Protein kinase domain-containing protein n=1 Tax=Symbiodinium microadriaticum TaxID=2951 RepID=A0A1Q9CZM8_SYMMI|nr:hypothetical protein AK812_SmicGene30283 [Symbiodinium microadriaticum]
MAKVVAAASGGVPVDAPGAEATVEQSTAVDIFDLGLLLLVSALGGMDILLGAIPYARNLGSDHPVSSPGSGTASLLLNELRGCATPEAAAAAADMGYLPPASDLLFNRRFSGHFLAFVSTCLEAHTQTSPVTARDLLQHEFLCAAADGGPLVSLREMQALSRILNEAPDHEPNRFVPGGRPQVPGVAPSVAQRCLNTCIEMPSPDEPLLGLMPHGWKASIFLKPAAMVMCASVSSTPMLNMTTLQSVSFEPINTNTSGEVYELPGCRLVVQMPSPDGTLLCLMPSGWKANDFLKPVADSSMVNCASVSSQPMFNMATLHSMSFEPTNAITSGEGHELPGAPMAGAGAFNDHGFREYGAQLYLMNLAQSIAPYCNWSLNGLTPRTGMDGTSTRRDASARRRGSAAWETLLADSARALGLPRQTVLSALEVQLERLRQTSAKARTLSIAVARATWPARGSGRSASLTERALGKWKEFATSWNRVLHEWYHTIYMS